jgi:hypothetical protein
MVTNQWGLARTPADYITWERSSIITQREQQQQASRHYRQRYAWQS